MGSLLEPIKPISNSRELENKKGGRLKQSNDLTQTKGGAMIGIALALVAVWCIALIGARLFPGDSDLAGRLRREEFQRRMRERLSEARERLGR